MKFDYQKPHIEIKNWLVSQKDIERLIRFFKERFSIVDVPISLGTRDGNNRSYDTYEEMVIDLPKLAADNEIVEEIEISYRDIAKDNYHNFKQSWIRIKFGEYGNALFWVIAGDTDGSYKDWVTGTYEEMHKLKDLFEVKDKRVIEKIEEKFETAIVFDPDESISESIESEIEKEKEIATSITTSVLSRKRNGQLA